MGSAGGSDRSAAHEYRTGRNKEDALYEWEALKLPEAPSFPDCGFGGQDIADFGKLPRPPEPLQESSKEWLANKPQKVKNRYKGILTEHEMDQLLRKVVENGFIASPDENVARLEEQVRLEERARLGGENSNSNSEPESESDNDPSH